MLTNQIAIDILHKLFPISEEELLRLWYLLNETGADFEEFRTYFYRLLTEEEWDEIDLEYSGITSYFYWYVEERMQNDFIHYFTSNKDAKIRPFSETYYPDPDLKYVDLDELEEEERIKIEIELYQEDMEYWNINESLYVNENYFIPRYRINGNNGDRTDLEEYFEDWNKILETIPEEKQTKMFKWFINQIYQDNHRPPKYNTKKPEPANIIDFSKGKFGK